MAGAGHPEFSGDVGTPRDAALSRPEFVTTDAANNVYFAMLTTKGPRVDVKTGIVTTIAGNGKKDSRGDGGLAINAGLEFPNSVAGDREGNIYISHEGDGPNGGQVLGIEAKSGILRR